MRTEDVAVAHRPEQAADQLLGFVRALDRALERAGQELVRQEPDRFREHAEDEANDEVRHRLRVVTPGAQIAGDLAHFARHLLGHLLARSRGPEALGVGEEPAEQVARARLAQLVDGHAPPLGDGVGEARDDQPMLEIADHEQRRVLERERVLLELGERGLEIWRPWPCTPSRSGRASTRPPGLCGPRSW